jgi:hypothetical protein
MEEPAQHLLSLFSSSFFGVKLLLTMGSRENRLMTEREAGTEILMRLPDQSLKFVTAFIEASKIFIFLFLFDQAS